MDREKRENFNVRMWQIFYDRFDNNITLQKLAEKHGVTRERIRQIEAKAISNNLLKLVSINL